MSFKVCSNLGCPFCLHHGVAAQFLPVAEACQFCGGGLLAVGGPSRSAPTVLTARRARPALTQQHMLFLAGLLAVLVPHLLAQAIGPVAYSLPVLAVAFFVMRAIGNMEPSWLATARAMRARELRP